MNSKLLGIVTIISGLALACGDSSSTSNNGGGSEGGGSEGGGTEGGGGSTGNLGGGGGGEPSCEEQHPTGAAQAATLVIQECGCVADSPCETECLTDDACITPGPETSEEACGDCIQAAADAQDNCAVTAAFSEDCTGDCADYVQCVLAS